MYVSVTTIELGLNSKNNRNSRNDNIFLHLRLNQFCFYEYPLSHPLIKNIAVFNITKKKDVADCDFNPSLRLRGECTSLLPH